MSLRTHCKKLCAITSLFITIPACGGSVTKGIDSTGGSAGAEGGGAPAGQGAAGSTVDGGMDGSGPTPEAAADATSEDPEPSPCRRPPIGDWLLTYEPPLVLCALPPDDLRITSDGASVRIDYLPCNTTEPCGWFPPTWESCCVSTGSFDPDRCEVRAMSRKTWFETETQCETRELNLFFRGDGAVGTMTRTKCYCGGGMGLPHTVRVTAVRQ